MEIDVTQIAVSVIGLMSVIITSVIVPLIRSKGSNDQWEAIKNYALAGVQAAEILLGAGKGEEKLQWASDYIAAQCKQHGIKVDMDTIRVAVENAWNQLGFNHAVIREEYKSITETK